MVQRKFGGQFAVCMIGYAAVLYGAVSLLAKYPGLPTWEAATIGLAPMIPLLFVLRIAIQSFRALDELERRIQADGLMFSVATTAVLVLSYGFLQVSIDAPKLLWFWVWPVQAATWIVGRALAAQRYK